MLSQAGVIPSVHRGCLPLCLGGVLLAPVVYTPWTHPLGPKDSQTTPGHAPTWTPLGHTDTCRHNGQQVGGTYPTGMLSCFVCIRS